MNRILNLLWISNVSLNASNGEFAVQRAAAPVFNSVAQLLEAAGFSDDAKIRCGFAFG